MFPCSQSVQGGCIGSVWGGEKTVILQIQRCTAGQRSVMWVLREPVSHYYIFFQTSIVPFSPSLLLVSVSFSVWRGSNWLHRAKAGRQAEGWSVKLVNHFLFSLRTAVDWWERPLCPPSQPASKFAASPIQWMAARRGGRRRGKKRALILQMWACSLTRVLLTRLWNKKWNLQLSSMISHVL